MATGIAWRFTKQTAASLELREIELLGLAERVGHLLSVEKELIRVTGGKLFVVHHEPLWRMVAAAVDATIIDLASWALGFYKKGSGGFLRNLCGPDLEALTWKLNIGEGPQGVEQHWVDAVLVSRRNAFDRLFQAPTSCGGRPVPSMQDIDALCVRLNAEFTQLRDDRNQHRAHKYEKKKPRTAAMLSLNDVTRHLEACQKLLADIRLLSSDSSFDAHGYKVRDDDSSVCDLVDLILCGPMFRYGPIFGIDNVDPGLQHGAVIDLLLTDVIDPGTVEPKWQQHYRGGTTYYEQREAFYERLRATHDAAGAKADAPFNGREA